jgi:PAS domain S-box-containing protein
MAVELRDREKQMELLSTAVGHAADGVIITDRDGTVQYVNDSVCNNTQFSREELLGRQAYILQYRANGHGPSFEMRDTIVQGHQWSGRIENRRKDGSNYLEQCRISPILDGSGEIGNFVGNFSKSGGSRR